MKIQIWKFKFKNSNLKIWKFKFENSNLKIWKFKFKNLPQFICQTSHLDTCVNKLWIIPWQWLLLVKIRYLPTPQFLVPPRHIRYCYFSSYLRSEILVVKTGQFGSLLLFSKGLWDFGKGREMACGEGKEGVSCRIIYNIYNVYNILAILYGGRFERCHFVAHSLVTSFFLWFRYPPIFVYVFSVIVFCVFLGKCHVVSPPSVYSLSI